MPIRPRHIPAAVPLPVSAAVDALGRVVAAILSTARKAGETLDRLGHNRRLRNQALAANRVLIAAFGVMATTIALYSAPVSDPVPAENHPPTKQGLLPEGVTYDPPPFLTAFQPHHDPGDDPLSNRAEFIEYLANDNRETHFRQLCIAVSRPGMKIGQGYRVTFDPVTDQDLIKIMEGKCTGRATNSPKVEPTTVAGRKALRMKCVVPMPQIHEGIIFTFEHIWVPVGPNEVIELTLVGSDEELLKSVRYSLSTLKIAPRKPVPPPTETPVPQTAKLAVRIGMERSAVSKESGKPIVSYPSYDFYFTGEYFVSVSYNLSTATMPAVDSISYFRSADPKKLMAAVRDARSENIGATLVEMTEEEIARFLSQQSMTADGSKSEWKKVKEDRWKRADEARAGYDKKNKTLIIATKELWEKLLNFRD